MGRESKSDPRFVWSSQQSFFLMLRAEVPFTEASVPCEYSYLPASYEQIGIPENIAGCTGSLCITHNMAEWCRSKQRFTTQGCVDCSLGTFCLSVWLTRHSPAVLCVTCTTELRSRENGMLCKQQVSSHSLLTADLRFEWLPQRFFRAVEKTACSASRTSAQTLRLREMSLQYKTVHVMEIVIKLSKG